MRRALLALALFLGACHDMYRAEAKAMAAKELGEPVICEFGYGVWNCVGLKTGRRVQCPDDDRAACVLVADTPEAP